MAEMITSLTKEQELALDKHGEQWLKYGLCTNPANRPEAEAGIKLAYEKAGVKPPSQFYWAEGPLAAVRMAANLYKNDSVDNDKGVTKEILQETLSHTCYGQHDVAWLSFYDFCDQELKIPGVDQIRGLVEVAKNAGWYWPLEDACVLTERPSVLKRDAQDRPHCEDGPALAFPDGFALYAWHGINVSKLIIETPEKITVSMIDDEENAEIRRIMLDRYGAARYVIDSGAKTVDTVEGDFPMVGLATAKLLVKEVPDDEDIVLVDVLNSTAEPDGSVKRYQLRVDPSAYNGDARRYAHAALASTWRLADGSLTFQDWRDYDLSAES